MVGLTGFEPVTPRLSSVCSNQLSYRPADAGELARLSTATSRGGNRIRTDDILLAKQALYQLSYTPLREEASRLSFTSCSALQKSERQRLNCTLRHQIRAKHLVVGPFGIHNATGSALPKQTGVDLFTELERVRFSVVNFSLERR